MRASTIFAVLASAVAVSAAAIPQPNAVAVPVAGDKMDQLKEILGSIVGQGNNGNGNGNNNNGGKQNGAGNGRYRLFTPS